MQQMMQCLIRKLAALSQYEEILAKISSTSTDRLTVLKAKPQSIQRGVLTICSDPYTLAQQLTHIELVRPLASSSLSTQTRSASAPGRCVVSRQLKGGFNPSGKQSVKSLERVLFRHLSMNLSGILGICLKINT